MKLDSFLNQCIYTVTVTVKVILSSVILLSLSKVKA